MRRLCAWGGILRVHIMAFEGLAMKTMAFGNALWWIYEKMLASKHGSSAKM